jgi:hypothetical protein
MEKRGRVGTVITDANGALVNPNLSRDLATIDQRFLAALGMTSLICPATAKAGPFAYSGRAEMDSEFMLYLPMTYCELLNEKTAHFDR